VTCTASDTRGNSATKSFKVTVQRCTFAGFFAPLAPESEGLEFIITSTQTVPVKFSLKGDYGVGIVATGYPKLINVPCVGAADGTLPAEDLSSVGSTLKYDTTSQQYLLGFQAKGKVSSSKCYILRLRLNTCPGTDHDIFLRVK
jgi:hypothetical protein